MSNKYCFNVDMGQEWDDLFAGPEIKVMNRNVKVANDAKIERGMLLAENGGIAAPATAADTDTTLFIASENFEAGSDTGVVTMVYTSGRFHRDKIKVGEGVDINNFEEPLRKVNIELTGLIQMMGEM